MFYTDSFGPQENQKWLCLTQIPQDLRRSINHSILHRFLRTLGDPEMVMFYTDFLGPQEIQKWLCFTQIPQDHMRSRNGCVSHRFFRTLRYTEMVMFYIDSLGPQGKLKRSINGSGNNIVFRFWDICDLSNLLARVEIDRPVVAR